MEPEKEIFEALFKNLNPMITTTNDYVTNLLLWSWTNRC